MNKDILKFEKEKERRNSKNKSSEELSKHEKFVISLKQLGTKSSYPFLFQYILPNLNNCFWRYSQPTTDITN